MNLWRVVVLFAVLFSAVSGSWATNPADPTADFRYGTDFLKVAWDNVGSASSSAWFFAQKEVGNRTAVLLFNSYDGDTRLYELGITKQFAAGEGTLEFGVFADLYHEGDNDAGAMLDWSNGQFGIGTVLREDGCSRVALRAKVSPRLTLNLSVPTNANEDSTRYGVGYSAGKVRLEFASDGDTSWFRASRPVGKNVFPELRTRFTDGESFVGLGIGFSP